MSDNNTVVRGITQAEHQFLWTYYPSWMESVWYTLRTKLMPGSIMVWDVEGSGLVEKLKRDFEV